MNKFKVLLVLFLLIFSTFSFNLKEVSAAPIPPVSPEMAWQRVIPSGFSEYSVSNTSLAIDSQDNLYIAFAGGEGNRASVMTYNGTSWENVGQAGFSAGQAKYISLAIDGNDKLYVAFADSTNVDRVTVMTYNGTSWENVGQAGFSAGQVRHLDLAIDGNNKLYVASASSLLGYRISVMTYNGIGWEAVGDGDLSSVKGFYTSLAINSQNNLYLAFSGYSDGNMLNVMTYNGTNWVAVGSPNFSAGSAINVSFAIDSQGKLYVAFSDGTNDYKTTVMTYNNTSSSWEISGEAGLSTNSTSYNSLSIDGEDYPYLAFSQEDGIYVLEYIEDGELSAWESVGETGFLDVFGSYLSLSVNSQGQLYASFGDSSRDNKATVITYDEFYPPTLPTFAGGSGIEGDPYQISTCQQLQDIDFTTNEGYTYPFLINNGKYFILTNNIDCTETESWNSGAGFNPIGSDLLSVSNSNDFSQTIHLDGNNKTISNLYINRPDKNNNGLFSSLFNSEIKDLKIAGDIIGGGSSGMLASGIYNTNIINVHTSGSISNIENTSTVVSGGGIVGVMSGSSSISKSSSSTLIESVVSGGIIGTLIGGTISDCYFNGNILDGLMSGGLFGINFPDGHVSNISIIRSYSASRLNGAITGGLFGVLLDTSLLGINVSISDSYSTSEVTNMPSDLVFESKFALIFGINQDFKTMGGLVGMLAGFQPMGETANSVVSAIINNSGWYKSSNVDLFDIGAYGYLNMGAESFSFVGEGIDGDFSNIFTESDNTLFYSKSHGVYAQGEEDAWDFTTPIWYEQLNDYPKFTAYTPDTSSPVVSNITANSITKTSATLNGEVTDNGGEEITEVGFEYGLTSSYATSTVESTDYASSTFSYDLTDLSCNTTYSYRAYATNTKGTSYSSSGTFTTDDCERSRSRVIGSVSRVIATLPVKEEVKPISTVTILNIKRILKQNIIGNDIKELQVWLNNHGYPIALTGPGSKGYETTKFGSLTKKAVMSFQKANGLTPDGVVGPLTLKKMNEIK